MPENLALYKLLRRRVSVPSIGGKCWGWKDSRKQVDLFKLGRPVKRLDTTLEDACFRDANRPLGKERVGVLAPQFASATHSGRRQGALAGCKRELIGWTRVSSMLSSAGSRKCRSGEAIDVLGRSGRGREDIYSRRCWRWRCRKRTKSAGRRDLVVR